MSIFGVSPFGTAAGPFGGPGIITILGVLPVGINEAIVVFDKPPLADDSEGFNSATNTKNWDIEAIDPSIPSTSDPSIIYIPPKEVVPTYDPGVGACELDDEDATQIHVFTEGPMEPRVRYKIMVQPSVEGADCETLAGVDTFEFQAPSRGPRRASRFVQEDRYRDLDMQFFPVDEKQAQGTWRHEPSGDIAIQDGEASLKKRVIRRILTTRGAFAHLPNYGIDPMVKSLARSGNIQALINDIAEQVRQEPDVSQVGVSAERSSTPGLLDLAIYIRRRELFDVRFTFQMSLR